MDAVANTRTLHSPLLSDACVSQRFDLLG